MLVLEGKDVDVIAPFPSSAMAQATQWMHSYKTLVFGDEGPQTNEEIEAFLREQQNCPNVQTWAVVDKGNLTSTKEDFPLVGIVFFEQLSPMNGYFHCASNRKAWGERVAQPSMMEQAGPLILKQIFEQVPTLQRVSAATFANNKAARNLLSKIGFHKDGYFVGMGRSKSQPVDVVHFGMVREG